MADNLKWFKVWTSITDDPDFFEMSLEDIARWMLLGAYIRKHGYNGKITISNQILSHVLRSQNLKQDIVKLHNVIIVENDNGKITVSFKNWFKYQIDSTGYERLKKHRKAKMITVQDKIRLDKIRLDKDIPLNDFDFNIFWEAYPKKKSKGDAEKAWKKIRPDKNLIEIILNKIRLAKESNDWKKERGQYIPYPASWLNSKGWEDEYLKSNKNQVCL